MIKTVYICDSCGKEKDKLEGFWQLKFTSVDSEQQIVYLVCDNCRCDIQNDKMVHYKKMNPNYDY